MSLFSFSRDIGIDMGTSRTRIYVPYRGVVFDEPSKLAFDADDQKSPLCIGTTAHEMVGRGVKKNVVHNTVSRGAIQDEKIAEEYLQAALRRVRSAFPLFRNDILIGTPTRVTSMEQRAIVQTCKRIGARNVITDQNAVLAAFGVGIHRDEMHGRMVTDIGAGLTEAAVISLGGLSSYRSVKVGGDDMDISVVRHIRQHYHLLVSEDVARQVKEKIGAVGLSERPKEIKVRGSDMNSRLPRIVRLTSNDIAEAIQPEIRRILKTIVSVFQDTPPELTADIIEKGLVLTGGVANLRGIASLVEKEVNIPVFVADDSRHAVIQGIGRSIQTGHLNFHKKTLLSK